jgi:hypothetical protein
MEEGTEDRDRSEEGWAGRRRDKTRSRPLTRVRGGGGEVVWVVLVLLLVLVLHEAIVEVWRRRSGVRVVLTGIVRVWCRLGLALALAMAVMTLALLVRGILLLLLLLLRVESRTSSRAPDSAGLSRSSSICSVWSRVERSLVF